MLGHTVHFVVRPAIVAAVFLSVLGHEAFAQVEQTELIASGLAEFDRFGLSVSIRDNLALVGVPWNNGVVEYAGAAHVFRCNGATWMEEAVLTAPDGQGENHCFGRSVAVGANLIVIGSHRILADGRGAAYVFRHESRSWIPEAILTPPDLADGDVFANSVAISGSLIVVGAPFDDDACPADPRCESGSAHVFRREGFAWFHEAKLTASDAAKGDRFGISVSLDGNLAVVGAHHDDNTGANTGSVYVFRREVTTWVEEAKLIALDAAVHDDFGETVSISGDRVVVGAPDDDDDGSFSGSAYVFRRVGTSWVQEAKLTASDAEEIDAFGWSVSIDDDWAIVGARVKNHPDYARAGAAYVFRRSGTNWTQHTKLTAPAPGKWHSYGYCVSLGGSFGVVGSPETGWGFTGSAYVFQLEP